MKSYWRPLVFAPSALVFALASFCQGRAQTGTLVALQHTASGLVLTHTEVAPFSLETLTESAISSDGYPSGVADIDCFGERFFYVRGIPQRLVTADAVTGELIQQVLVDNPLNADVRLSNIAYDWTDDRLIGTAASTSDLGNTLLHLVEVDPSSGEVEVLSDSPAVGADHGSGNCDLDAAGNRFYLLGTDKLFTWDALSGGLLGWSEIPDLDSTASGQTLTHLAHHPIENALYALHKREPDNFDPYGPWFQSELRLVKKVLPAGEWEFVSGDVLSMDGIQSGQCDLDPFNNRFYYVQDGKVRVVDCSTGELLFTLNTSSTGVISEWANLQFHDLSTPAPATSSIAVSDTVWVEWDGTTALNISQSVGGMLTGDWSNGPGQPTPDGTFLISGYGPVDWSGMRTGANGGSVHVAQHFEVIPSTPTHLPVEPAPLRASVFPNPCAAGQTLTWRSGQPATTASLISLSDGRTVAELVGRDGEWPIPGHVPPGLYLLRGPQNERELEQSAPFVVASKR